MSQRFETVLACVLGVALASAFGKASATTPSTTWPFIEVDPGSITALRERGSNRPFVAVGVNYFDPETGWAPKLWQKYDESRIRRHLRLIHDQGFNTIRVFLTLQSFHSEPGTVDAAGLEKFRRFLTLCREASIRVIPTGPDHWEGLPAWRQPDPYADETNLEADEAWWRAFASVMKDEATILGYDLLNEPAIRWDTPAMREKWNRWLANRYETAHAIAVAWGMPAEAVGQLGDVAVPPAEPARGDVRLHDYQCFREHIGDEWTRRLANAIRSVDRNHPVTVGHVQWAGAVYFPGVEHYAGFNLKTNAEHVDFVSIHFYPLEEPRPSAGSAGMAANAAYLEALLHEASVGKPLMLGEFGWYGGGALIVDGQTQLPDRPAAHQVEWNRTLLDVSRGRVCGWLNWAFADVPAAADLTRWSGCWTTDLTLKPWGESFGAFARQITADPAPPRAFPDALWATPPDRRALLTDPAAGAEWRARWRDRRPTTPAD